MPSLTASTRQYPRLAELPSSSILTKLEQKRCNLHSMLVVNETIPRVLVNRSLKGVHLLLPVPLNTRSLGRLSKSPEAGYSVMRSYLCVHPRCRNGCYR